MLKELSHRIVGHKLKTGNLHAHPGAPDHRILVLESARPLAVAPSDGANAALARASGRSRPLPGSFTPRLITDIVALDAERRRLIAMQNVSWKLLACILVCVSAFAARADAENVVVKHFENGAGSNAVGVADASEDTEIDGPQALTSGDNGDLFLLDQVNGRILRFDPRQPTTAPRVLALPTDVQPTDLVVRKSDILVWDGSVRTLKTSGAD